MAAAERSFRFVISIFLTGGRRQDILDDLRFLSRSKIPAKLRKIRHSTGIFAVSGMLNEIPTQSGQSCAVWSR
jgi:hypothetical protein